MPVEILEFPLNFLKITWQHSSTGKTQLATTTVVYPVLSTIVLMTVSLQLFNENANVESFVQNIQALGIYSGIFGKFVVYRLYRKEFFTLIDTTRYFWKTEMCTSDVRTSLDNLLLRTLLAQKFFAYSSFSCIVLVLISPIFTKQLPLGILYNANKKSLLLSVLVQEICMSIGIVYVVAYDAIYFGFCMNLILQFKILNNLLEGIQFLPSASRDGNSLNLDKLKLCIEQHKLLLQFSDKLKQLFSPILLVQHSTVALILCAEMFAFFDSTNVGNSINHLFRILILTGQLALYCIPIDYIMEEAVRISKMLYNCNWYTYCDSDLKNTLPIVMQRSQKDLVFKAGGLIDINSRAILTVFKVGWSICMVMRDLRK